jgi:hypothetical protein
VLALPLFGGCALFSHHAAAPPPPPPPKRTKLAVLKVDSDQFPEVARALNNQMRDVHMKGIDDYFLSKVTLEVVQLSIECVEPTAACYTAVGKSLSADKLLMARIVPGPVPKRVKKKDRVPAVNVTVTLFDVEAGSPVDAAEKQFKNAAEASQGLTELVLQATGQAAATKPAQSATKDSAAKDSAAENNSKPTAQAAQ